MNQKVPTVGGDPRNQAYVILLLAFLTQYFGRKLTPELVGPITTVLIVVVGAVATPCYMFYGIWMSKLRQKYQKATTEALVEAAKSPEPVQNVVVEDPVKPGRRFVVRLHDIEKKRDAE